jgi:hypothetical protein
MVLKLGIKDLTTVFCMLALFIAGTGMLTEAESAGSIEANVLHASNNTTPTLAEGALPSGDHSDNVTAPDGKRLLPADNETTAAYVLATPGGLDGLGATFLTPGARNSESTSLATWLTGSSGDNTGELTRIALEMLTHLIKGRYPSINSEMQLAFLENNGNISTAIGMAQGDIATTI